LEKESMDLLISVMPEPVDFAYPLMDPVDLQGPDNIRMASSAFFIENIKG
jgi:hypothetical protein